MKRIAVALLLAALAVSALAQSAAPKSAADKPCAVEYYYKVQWGHQDEFLRLFKKNHYPLLKKQIETGRILRVEMVAPENHMTEDARWDFRVTIVFRNVAALYTGESDALTRQLYPDQETFRKEEQRRFEILLAHWDLPVTSVDLEKTP
ncbi:MAG TPA: hypothetical protein VFA60_13355 [Terriglobales bacterium]|nr:hypothetical protein [Terriglobales bacterium]